MKKISLAITLVAVLAISFALPSQASDVISNEETYFPTVMQEPGWQGVNFDGAFSNGEPSYLYASLMPNFFENNKLTICHSMTDKDCANASKNVIFRSNFVQCQSASELDCIESISMKKDDGTIQNASFVREWGQSDTFPADPETGLPAGHGWSSWKIGDQLYGVNVSVNGLLPQQERTKNGRVRFNGLSAKIQPISEVSKNVIQPEVRVMPRINGDGFGWDGTAIGEGCSIYENGKCGLRQSFDLNSQFSLKIRTSQPITGWLHGRLRDADISINNITDMARSIAISAKPLAVPMVSVWKKWNELPADIQALYPAGSGGTSRNWSDFTTTDLANRTLRDDVEPAGQRAIDRLNSWNPIFGDKATNMKTQWVVQTIFSSFSPQQQACLLKDGVSGYVGTNSTVYSDGTPTFTPETESLDYTVGAPHYDSKGNVFGGFYQLNMQSNVARCLYGFSNAPISAKIEVASQSGEAKIAVTTVSEKDNWLNLTASNFSFSNPKISVKLTQHAPEKAKPVVVVKKITCKNSKGKKVTTTGTCPTGYKKI